ncbi:MAG: SMC-Scp complex subunit ScpB [Phycisphaerales bacterium]
MTNGLDTTGVETRSIPTAARRRGAKKKASEGGAIIEPEPTVTVEDEARDDQLLGSVEAVLLSVDRPVSALRLAEALGLIDGSADDAIELTSRPAHEEEERPAGGAGGARGGVGASRRRSTPVGVVKSAVAELNREYEATGRAFRIESVAGGYRLMTLPRYSPVIEEFLGRRERTALSRPAVETLAIIAYRQPITRAQLEAVRGVACGEVLKTLVERRLVTITGRAEELGRPMLYGTTKPFLETFGLSSLKDLPSIEEFRARHTGGGGEGD